MLPIQTILHPTDFSECSQYGFRLACSLARDHKARLVVLHVVPQLAVFGEAMRRPSDSYFEGVWNDLRRLRPPDPQIRVEHRLEEGDPTTEIVHTAQEINCDLIVMGTHGRTGLKRLLMGSVAEQVVRKALCLVLTVKAPRPKGRESDLLVSLSQQPGM